jgi:hypothetical protein
MTGYNILSSGDAENDYPLFFPETNLDLINSRSIPPEYSYTRNSSGLMLVLMVLLRLLLSMNLGLSLMSGDLESTRVY